MEEKVLSEEQTAKIRRDFLEKLGRKLMEYRERKNIPQSVLAKYIGVSGPALSKYETGTNDMKVSNLPLLSLYCDFPMSDLFPEDESKRFLKAVGEAIRITARRYQRVEKEKLVSQKVLKKRIYEVGGEEVVEPVLATEHLLSEKENMIRGNIDTMAAPLSGEELYEYVKEKDDGVIRAINSAGELLKDLEQLPQKETLKSAIAGFVVNEMITIVIEKPEDDSSKRLYAYYKALYDKYKEKAASDSKNP